MKNIVLAAAFTVLSSAALSHDYWGNGSEVNPRTKELCCGQDDCKEVAPEHMHVSGQYYIFDDLDIEPYPDSQSQPSPDGRIWRCVWQHKIRCLFVPGLGT